MPRTLFALLGLMIIGGPAPADELFVPLQLGQAVPVYTVRLLSGSALSLGGPEPVTLVNIWATWCGPCRQEFPELERIYRTYRSRGLRFIAISVDRDGENKVRRFIKNQAVTFPVALDEHGTLRRNYQSEAVPESLLIGSAGQLLWRKSGAFADGAADARAAIDAALHR